MNYTVHDQLYYDDPAYQSAVTMLLEKSMVSMRIAVLGGSHGGYLACHLLGQFPVSRSLSLSLHSLIILSPND